MTLIFSLEVLHNEKEMAKNMTEKQLANLRPIQKGERRNPHPQGRPRKLVNAIKSLPDDIQEQVYGILAYVLTLPDEETAKEYLEVKKGELGKYGFVLQVAIRQLTAKGWGWGAMMDILDRLYGKPKQNTSVDVKGDGTVIIVKSLEEKEKIDNIGNLDV